MKIKRQRRLYIWQRFGKLPSSDPGVYEAVHTRRPSVLRLVQRRSLEGGSARHCGDQCSALFHYYSLVGDNARPEELRARCRPSISSSGCVSVCAFDPSGRRPVARGVAKTEAMDAVHWTHNPMNAQ